MKTRLQKIVRLLCLVSLFTCSRPFANAEPTTTTAVAEPRFDIQIENGQLSLSPLKGRVDANQFTMGPGAQPADIESVPATVDNLAKYLRAIDTNLNIVVSGPAAGVQINNLKLHAADMEEVGQATSIATDMAVYGGHSSGRNNWLFATQPQKNPTRTVEVFNISGFIHSLGTTNREAIHKELNDIENNLIFSTIERLHQDESNHAQWPVFNYHAGTGLLIVIGTPEEIEVTRKVIDALPGQQAAQLEQARKLFDELDKAAAEKQK